MKLTKINGKYELWLPEHRAAREQWNIANGGWEVERINEMLAIINPNDIVYDLGTEEADISALIAKYTKAQMVLVEPNDRVWGCMKATWDSNNLPRPLGFYGGFFSSESNDLVPEKGWENITTDNLIPDHGFKQLYEKYPDVPQITMDRYCLITGIYPTVITMDVEGAEWNVIKGAEQTLRKYKPIIFMSVHAEFLYESYRNEGEWKEKYGERCFVVHMLRFIKELGYNYRVIEWDFHECHFIFMPVK